MNTSFLQLASTLSISDWQSLRKFLLMYSNEDTDLINLFDTCYNYREKLEMIDIHLEHFEKLTKKGFQNLGSKLFSITEDWFAWKVFNSDKDQKELVLNKAYNDQGLYKLANQKSSKLEKRWSKTSQFSVRNHQKRSQLLHQQYYSDNPIKYEKKSTLLYDLSNNYLVTQKLQGLLYLMELHNWGTIKQIDFSEEIQILYEVIEKLPESKLTVILNDLVLLISELDLQAFLRVKEELMNDRFETQSELHQLVTLYVINFCIKLWQKGIFTNKDESARVIEYGLSSGILLKSGRIPRVRFYNLLATLGALKSFEWNIDFIDRWKHNVETESVESTEALAKAICAFLFKKYDLILELLRNVEFEDYADKNRALGLELISWYINRKENYAFLRTFINNYKRTLKRNDDSTSAYFVKSSINLIKVIELLIQSDFRRVTINLKKFEFLIYRSWLEEEIQKRKAP